ncbi:hypothetical protein C8R43DRAFT_1235314 [Mycena crocata]|nr:hypothetical protein C8R43DRAFT_1235314 [Mycena crocata]
MPTNVAIVDERDSAIQYSGSWTAAGTPQEFHGTTTRLSVGSTASFTFVVTGTSVTVYGSVAQDHPQDCSMSFAVDGTMIGSYSYNAPGGLSEGLFHEALWKSAILQTAVGTQGQIYLDYITYTTTSTTSVDKCFIDDTNSRVTYTGPAWRKFTGGQTDFEHTSQESSSAGDSFSITFEGESIDFYGGLTPSDAGVQKLASMVLDGGTPVIYNAPQNPPASSNNIFYSSGVISSGKHTLVVTSESENTLWADYFLVTPNRSGSSTASPNTSVDGGGGVGTGGTSAVSFPSSLGSTAAHSGTASLPSGQSTASSPSGAGTTPGATLSASAPFSSSSAPSSDSPTSILPVSANKSTPVAAIVGAVLGTLLLVAFILAGVFYLRRRKRRQASEAPVMSAVTPRPFSPFANAGSAMSRTALTSSYNDAGGGKLAAEARRQNVTIATATGSATSSKVGYSGTETVPPFTSDSPSAAGMPLRASSILSGTASVVGSSRFEPPPQYSA